MSDYIDFLKYVESKYLDNFLGGKILLNFLSKEILFKYMLRILYVAYYFFNGISINAINLIYFLDCYILFKLC